MSDQEEWWVWPLLAVLGVFGAVKLWQAKVRPWIEDTWTQVTAGDAVLTLPGVGALDETDMVGIGVLLAVVLAVVVAAARRWRARRVAVAEAAGQSTPPQKPKTKRGMW